MNDKIKQETQHAANRAIVRDWFVEERHCPLFVRTGESIWNPRTVPVGRRLDKWAVPLKVFLINLCNGVFIILGECSRRGCICCSITA